MAKYRHIIGSLVKVKYQRYMTTGKILNYFPSGNYYEVSVKGITGSVIYTARELDAWN